jgi:hypothetical protein
MGENIDALVWRSEQVDVRGEIVTAEALMDMVDALWTGSIITRDFNFRRPVGQIDQAWIDDHDLYVQAYFDDVDLVELLRQGKLAIRPGFEVEKMHLDEAGHRVLDELGEVHVAVLSDPMPLPGDLSTEQFSDGCVGEHKPGYCPEWSA